MQPRYGLQLVLHLPSADADGGGCYGDGSCCGRSSAAVSAVLFIFVENMLIDDRYTMDEC